MQFTRDGAEFGNQWWSESNEAGALAELPAGEAFEDMEFGAATAGERAGAPPGPVGGACAWRRPADALGGGAALFASADPFVLRPCAALGNSPMLAAIAALSTRADLMLRVFESVARASSGAYTLSLFVHGRWRAVLLDSQLPVGPGGELLCASLASEPLAFAPALLEKGLAKALGGYSKLRAASAEQTLLALTGGSVERRLVEDDESAEAALASDMHAVDVAGDLLLVQIAPGGAAGGEAHGLEVGRLYVLLGFATSAAAPSPGCTRRGGTRRGAGRGPPARPSGAPSPTARPACGARRCTAALVASGGCPRSCSPSSPSGSPAAPSAPRTTPPRAPARGTPTRRAARPRRAPLSASRCWGAAAWRSTRSWRCS